MRKSQGQGYGIIKIDKKVIISHLPFLFIFWLADKLAYMYRLTEGNKIFAVVKGVSELFNSDILFIILSTYLWAHWARLRSKAFCMCGA